MRMMVRNLLHAVYFGGFVVTSLQAWVLPLGGSSSTTMNSQKQRVVLFMAVGDNANHNHNNQQHLPEDESSIPSSSHSNSNANANANANNSTEFTAEKKFRLAKAQAEIDRILNCPVDPPFDVEGELKKVVSMSPPLIPEGSSEYELEEQVSQMEAELYRAVKQQDYATASQRSQELSQKHVDDCGLVLQVQSKFYEAFKQKDADEMERVWLPDRSCVCIHPSHKPILGSRDIGNSWRKMFSSSEGSFQRSWMEPHAIRLSVKATTAIVTCEQHVFARRFVRGQKRQTELINKLMATNIFRKVGDKWYMTYHHASWHADSEPAKMALKQGGGGMSNKRSSSKIVIRGRKEEEDDDDSSTGIDNILGINNFGPLLGDSSKNSNSNNNDENQPKRIILGGSISDMLNGGLLGDILGDNKRGNTNGMGGGEEDDDDEIGNNGAIIHFNTVDDDDDDDEDDDDEDDEDDEIESVTMLKQWGKQAVESTNPKNKKQQQQQQHRQNCIEALRKLANQGRISPKQKRILLTDIITCSAKGEYSMVEVAYELLMNCDAVPGEKQQQTQKQTQKQEGQPQQQQHSEEAEEEFADQCIVFAESFTHYPPTK